jgi:predicted DNA-binding transcriptional regulator AlpA
MELLDRLLSARELAAHLGVPVTTLYAWRYRGEGPPGFRVGRHLRYRWRDVDLWIRGRREDPAHRHLEPLVTSHASSRPAGTHRRHGGNREGPIVPLDPERLTETSP